MVRSEYKYLYVVLGINGRNSDGEIWRQRPWKDALEKHGLDITNPNSLPDRENKVSDVCTGDDAFQISIYMTKLFPQINLTKERQVFNNRWCWKRPISNSDFWGLADRWRVWNREQHNVVTVAAITLYNWLRLV